MCSVIINKEIKMIVNHAAIMCSSEEKAEMFYKGIFEMDKVKDFIVQKNLVQVCR